jgi:hypothetical protein
MFEKLRRHWSESAIFPLSAIGWSYLLYAYLLQALHIHTPPVCLFYLVTGVHCPLCGMTRAFGALMAGHEAEAVLLYPLAISAFVLWLIGSLSLSGAFVLHTSLAERNPLAVLRSQLCR